MHVSQRAVGAVHRPCPAAGDHHRCCCQGHPHARAWTAGGRQPPQLAACKTRSGAARARGRRRPPRSARRAGGAPARRRRPRPRRRWAGAGRRGGGGATLLSEGGEQHFPPPRRTVVLFAGTRAVAWRLKRTLACEVWGGEWRGESVGRCAFLSAGGARLAVRLRSRAPALWPRSLACGRREASTSPAQGWRVTGGRWWGAGPPKTGPSSSHAFVCLPPPRCALPGPAAWGSRRHMASDTRAAHAGQHRVGGRRAQRGGQGRRHRGLHEVDGRLRPGAGEGPAQPHTRSASVAEREGVPMAATREEGAGKKRGKAGKNVPGRRGLSEEEM